jgi:pSer/pThr/pTyr-binding forkhead associated (FHA) protein
MEKLTTAQNGKTLPTELTLTIVRGKTEKDQYHFIDSFKIGRDETCAIQFDEEIVSRVHAEVKLENGQWWLEDLNSTNGTFLNGQKINRIQITSDLQIELGIDGPQINFKLSLPDNLPDKSPSVTHFVEHYFDDKKEETEVGQHTRMVRDAFERLQKKRSSKYYIIIGVVVLLFIFAGAYSIYQHMKVSEQKELAEEIFYNMKSLELQLAQLQQAIGQSNDSRTLDRIKEYNTSRTNMEANYDNFVEKLGIYEDKDETERLILKMARLFGECELNVPPDFVSEVKKYIRNWQSTPRYAKAIQRAKEGRYVNLIVEKMLAKHLPPQFFYLALQESDFNHRIVGPRTKYGYAKGIWQFIPQTALQYGLETGPLVELNQYDPRDERFDMEKATTAASSYISDIYNTEAQASGLLVIASYNWGEHNVRNLIAKLPANPRERNLWKLMEQFKNRIPSETYKYVFYIFSAAVIGENPALFGFDFKNPLKKIVEEKTY